MGFLLELVLEAVWMLVGDLVFGLLGAIFERSRDRLAPSWRFGRDRARLMVALAPLVGATVGSLSLTLAPRRLTSDPLEAVATWIVIPAVAGACLWGLERLRRSERRAPASAALAGVLFGLSWLAVRLVIPKG